MATYRRGYDPDRVVRAMWISRQAKAEAAWLAATAGGGDLPGGDREARHPEARARRIGEFAYLKAERRGFHPGREMQDWLEAEREVDATTWS